MQSKQLSTNDSAVLDLDAVVIICVERGSQIHGIRPLNKLTVGDVHRTLCEQKQTYLKVSHMVKLLLYVRQMVTETRQIGFGPVFYNR